MEAQEINTDTLDEQPTAVADATLSVAEIGPWFATAYQAVATALAAQGATPVGPPFARYHRIDDERFTVEAGFPVARRIDGVGDVRPSSLPGGVVATTVHVGPYDTMEPTYDALVSWVRQHGGEPTGDAWEIYLSDPQQPDPATWRTTIVQPYRRA